MTATSARNTHGLFKTKNAKNLALLYNLNIHDISFYTSNYNSNSTISYYNVKLIIDGLWLNHFMFGSPKPRNVSPKLYDSIFLSLQKSYPQYLDFSFA